MAAKNYIRRNIYRWHRITSLIVAIPVLLWTVSGFLHPVMNSSKPDVKNQVLPAAAIDHKKIKLTLKEALSLYSIDTIRTFRIVELYGAPYYQVQYTDRDTLSYISCSNGQFLFNGDQQYAGYLAQRYLSEPNGGKQEEDHHGAPADTRTLYIPRMKMSGRVNVNILDVRLEKNFTAEYRKSNLLLPVYRVQFDRADHIRLYIETTTGRMAAAIDDRKAWFTKFFAITHTWSFLDGLGKGKNLILGCFSLLCFLTSLFGFYVHNLTKKKRYRNTPEDKHRSRHRVLGNIFVITTLLYAFSGAWHSFSKLAGEDNAARSYPSSFTRDELDLPLATLASGLDSTQKLTNISVVKMEGQNYWQLSLFNKKQKQAQKKYIHTGNLCELNDGDDRYGRYLASRFSGKPSDAVMHSQNITAFSHGYSMMNKRLPVIEVSFGDKKSYYVETSTGCLAAVAGPAERSERFSFSNLHLHHYWEMWLGKERGRSYKNLVLISSTLGLLLLAFTGLAAYSLKKWKKRKLNREDTRTRRG